VIPIWEGLLTSFTPAQIVVPQRAVTRDEQELKAVYVGFLLGKRFVFSPSAPEIRSTFVPAVLTEPFLQAAEVDLRVTAFEFSVRSLGV
jgi:hypothetical protein